MKTFEEFHPSKVLFDKYHPEKRENEIHLENASQKWTNDNYHDIEYKRLGHLAFDINGNPIQKEQWGAENERQKYETLPLFFDRNELERLGYEIKINDAGMGYPKKISQEIQLQDYRYLDV